MNYGLKEMDWLTVKLKAGRIVPALATTTAAIAGLQTIELIKLIKRAVVGEKKFEVEQFRNCFLNLAVPSFMCSEAGAPEKFKIKQGLSTNVWDRWEIEVTKQTKMATVLDQLQTNYKLACRDIIYGS